MAVDLQVLKQFALFENSSSAVLDEITRYAVLKTIPAGQQLAFEGINSEWFFILLSGSIRVFKLGENGREVTLYHVQQQESCVLTIFSILSKTGYPAFALSETRLEALMIPAQRFKKWVNDYGLWREHVFNSLSGRLQDLLLTIDKVTFQRVDARIAEFLNRQSRENDGSVLITHEKLAREVGSARVVVSRILEEFERSGLVVLARGRIRIVDREKLIEKIDSGVA